MSAQAKRLLRLSIRPTISARPAIQSERGASAVEFAILAPLLFMVVLGMFSGGLAFSRKIALTDASREAVRYGATLSLGGNTVPPDWFLNIRNRAINSAGSELATTWDGQYVCVAYVGLAPDGSGPITERRVWNGDSGPIVGTGQTCIADDGRGASERRVQVAVRRNSTFQALVFSTELQLEAEGVARFEAISPS